MGQKVNPIGMRLGVNRTWESRWYAEKGEYANLLHEDLKIRSMVFKDLRQAGISRVVIERPHKKCRVTIHSARPGVIIGKKGADIEKLKQRIGKMTDSEVVLTLLKCVSLRLTRNWLLRALPSSLSVASGSVAP